MQRSSVMKEKLRYKINMTPFEMFNSVVLLFIAVMVFIGVMWMGGTLIGYGGLSSDTYYSEYKPMIIISESMTPTIAVNGLLLVEAKPFDELEVNDIIVFNTYQYGLVGHRIVQELDSGFRTKGDNNVLIDNWVVTEEMYKGHVAEIHNEFAPFITLLFGDLDNLSLDKLFLGFFLMAGLLILIIMLAKNLYDYIFVYYFIKKSSKSGGANVMAEYYTDSVLKIEDEKLVELFDTLENGKDLSLLGRLRLRYDILRLHNILHHRNRINRRLKYLTNLVRKDLG